MTEASSGENLDKSRRQDDAAATAGTSCTRRWPASVPATACPGNLLLSKCAGVLAQWESSNCVMPRHAYCLLAGLALLIMPAVGQGLGIQTLDACMLRHSYG